MSIEIITTPWICRCKTDVIMINHKDKNIHHPAGTRFFACKTAEGENRERLLLFDGTYIYPSVRVEYCKEYFELLTKSDYDVFTDRLRRLSREYLNLEFSWKKVKKG